MKEINNVPCIKIGDIVDALGLGVNKSLMERLHIVPFANEGNATYYRADLFDYICDQIIRHIQLTKLQGLTP